MKRSDGYRIGLRLAQVLLLSVCFSVAAGASATTVTCNGCDAVTMESTAQINVEMAPVPSNDVIYVVNETDNVVRKWSFTKSYDDPNVQCDPNAYEVELQCVVWTSFNEEPVEQAVAMYVNYINAYSGNVYVFPTYDPILGLPPSAYPQDGYQLMANPEMQLLVGRYIREGGFGGLQDLLTIANALNPISWFHPENIVMRVRVVTADGSTHVFIYNVKTDAFEFQPKESRDSKGNRIPQDRLDVVGGTVGTTIEYDFTGSPDTLQDFIDRMTLLGVDVIGSLGNTNETKFSCRSYTRKEENQEVVVVECIKI